MRRLYRKCVVCLKHDRCARGSWILCRVCVGSFTRGDGDGCHGAVIEWAAKRARRFERARARSCAS